MILVRHGLMIVGDPLGGKTSAFKTLAAALGNLHAKGLMEETPVSYDLVDLDERLNTDPCLLRVKMVFRYTFAKQRFL